MGIKSYARKAIILVIASMTIAAFQGCQSLKFVKVDFKYNNLSHMSVDDSMVKLDASPNELIIWLSDNFRSQGGSILDRESIDYFFSKTPLYKNCWHANKEISDYEFESYRKNNFHGYQNIDRLSIYDEHDVAPSCKYFDKVHSAAVEAWYLVAELPQGTYKETITLPSTDVLIGYPQGGLVYGTALSKQTQQIESDFYTKIFIWAWKESKNSKTKVYLFAKPVNSQIESCSGCTIGYKWWERSNGYAEYKLVKDLKYLIDDFFGTE